MQPNQQMDGERLRQLRVMKGLSREGLGRRAGVSSKTVLRFERGNSNPTEKTIKKLTDALEASGNPFDTKNADPMQLDRMEKMLERLLELMEKSATISQLWEESLEHGDVPVERRTTRARPAAKTQR